MASTENVPFFKKKRARPTTTRQRSPPPSAVTAPISSSSKSEVVLPTRKANTNLLSAGTKRTASQRHADGDDDDDESRHEGPGINWSSTGGHIKAVQDILEGDEAEEMLAKRQKKPRTDEDEVVAPDDGLYHGQKAYKTHIKKSQEVPKSMRTGPQRSSGSTIRTVTIVDYQPDVCKDYKETGFCGFGDTCKFLHDRGTYLQGWQLDKLAANPKKEIDDNSDSDSDEEDIPFACIICRKPYTEPVVTRCGHYLCSACAIKRFAKTPKCAACGAPTGGIFNRAEKVLEKIRKKQKAKEDEQGSDDGGEQNGVKIEGLGDGGDAKGEGSDSDDDDSDDD
ncbi:hypothetical protein EWM64_g2035 [Hericium alpestre]|uniref:Pre-mRNA-splicing factor CWC24 n=1 Tax=Hericium alpestre TaxID=135208 RepID=A0A4Z0A6Q5_9AGAM|nr:hypothetical protein EWM64_g2035 [Hericium alpestre]